MFSKDPIINLENFQKQQIYYGYFLGFNSFDFKVDYKTLGPDILVKKLPALMWNRSWSETSRIYKYTVWTWTLLYKRDLNFPGFSAKEMLYEK
jgi:hypothetical protein